MKKYLRFQCSVCKRTIDKPVDDSRATIDKCTITLKCQGRLAPVAYLSNAQLTISPSIGVQDWRARGSTETAAAMSSTTFIDTSCGTSQQIVLAIQPPALQVPGIGSTVTLKLNVRASEPKAFKQFVYRIESSFSTISGVESGLDKKTLRYSSADLVEVYVDGVKLEQGTAPENFSIYSGSSSSAVPPNTIRFNSIVALPGITQVDVIVSQASAVTTNVLTFIRNIGDESRLNTGSWENVDSVQTFDGNIWYLYTLDLSSASALQLNTILSVASASLDGVQRDLAYLKFMLARKPYTVLDRYTNIAVPLDTLSLDRDYLKYVAVDGIPTLFVTANSTTPVYPIFKVKKFNQERTIKISTPGVSDQVLIDGAVVVGPDA